jgi:hypothetical protein
MNWLREPDAEPIPGYRLICPLGTGGFGEVWKCVAPGNIHKAIKFVYGNLNSPDDDNFRAEQEFKAVQKIKEIRYPFILSMERIDIVDGDLAIVMELADCSLYDLLQKYQAEGYPGIPRAKLIRYLRDAADGLDYLNECGLQHLDVKPRNLFLVGDRVKVADFGLVKSLDRQSSSGLLAGVTPIYAAPETFSGKFSRQSDQYSLGIVYVELLTGRRPFNGKSIRSLAFQHVSEPPDLSGVPETDRPVILRALAKDPEERYPSCQAFIAALTQSGEVPTDGAELAYAAARAGVGTSVTAAARSAVNGSAPHGLECTVITPETAVLRPTLIIAAGEFGRKAILDLRCRLLDRFGDLSQIPIFRFVYLDSDPDALHAAQQGPPEVALSTAQLVPLPLQPVASYRRRTLENLADWLPREKLNALPRSLQPQGSRALGRLAFHDNYLRLLTRFRRELQAATHPESLTQSVSHTGLALRDNHPRIAILASACGGSSGMLVDLAFALNRVCQQLNLKSEKPTLFLYGGAPNDPATPTEELANLYATLTEVHHYYAGDTGFSAQYGPDCKPIVDASVPISAAYLLVSDNHTPESESDCVAQLANYLHHEITTPLGQVLELQRARQKEGCTPFRSFGTHSVWYPRGLLLRAAAREACNHLIRQWQTSDWDGDDAEIDAWCHEILQDAGLQWESLAKQIEEAATTVDGSPPEVLSRLLSELSDDSVQTETVQNPWAWAAHAVSQVENWVGCQATSCDESVLRRSRFSLAYSRAAKAVADKWARRWFKEVRKLANRPGCRTAAVEQGIRRLIAFCEQAAAAQSDVVSCQRSMIDSARQQLRRALQQCRSGGSTFGRFLSGNADRHVRSLLEQLRIFAFARLAEDALESGTQFFQHLQSSLHERLADLEFVRQRLRHLQADLVDILDFDVAGEAAFRRTQSYNGILKGSKISRIVLPEGVKDLNQAAHRFVEQISPELYRKLDETVHALVLEPRGGLISICQKNSDLDQVLAAPLIEHVAAFLGEQLPTADVVEAELTAANHLQQPVERHIQKFALRAAPLVQAPGHRDQTIYLLLPESDSAHEWSAAVERALDHIDFVPGSGPTDMTFCREQGYLMPEELAPFLEPCRTAYDQLCQSPSTSPHSRFDVPEWLPLQ